MFSLVYNMHGGLTYSDCFRMKKGEFIWWQKRLLEQLKKENEAIKSTKSKSGEPKSGRFSKFLGR